MVTRTDLEAALKLHRNAENVLLETYADILIHGHSGCQNAELAALQSLCAHIMSKREITLGSITIAAVQELLDRARPMPEMEKA